MNLKNYFSEHKGTGVIATSNKAGVVDMAIYSTPHVLSDDELAFIMRDRLTHSNLQENYHAGYLFMETGQGYKGVRFFLSKIDESTDHDLIEAMTRRHLSPEQDKALGDKYLVRFKVDRVLQLIGGVEIPLD